MSLGLQGFFHPLQVETHKPTESIHGNLPLAVGSADRLRDDFEGGGQLIDGQPCLFHHVSFTVTAHDVWPNHTHRRVVVKEARSWTLGDNRGH
jgi:hypothetical protein